MSTVHWPVVVPDALQARPPWATATDADKAAARASAVATLYGLTGRVFGTEPVTCRPVFGQPDDTTTYAGPTAGHGAPVVWAGLIAGRPEVPGTCGCPDPLCSGRYDHTQVPLPGPVASVTEVLVDGDPVTAYRVYGRRWLRRTDGLAWPARQDMDAADDEPGAFTVRYLRGIEVPLAGQQAAGILAVDYLRGVLAGTADCSLPAGVRNVDREGVTIELDPAAVLDDGLTGIDKVDRWVVAVNPYRRKSTSRVVVPGRRRSL